MASPVVSRPSGGSRVSYAEKSAAPDAAPKTAGKTERGFRVVFRDVNKEGGDPYMKAYGDGYAFEFRIWVPIETDEMPPPFIATTLNMGTFGIDCGSLVDRLRPLALANIFSLKDVADACRKNTLAQFVENIEQPLRWKQNIAMMDIIEEKLPTFDNYGERIHSRKRLNITAEEAQRGETEMSKILRFLQCNVLEWKKICNSKGKERLYIPKKDGENAHPFEYFRDGSLMMYFTYGVGESLVMNIETGESFGVVHYEEEQWAKISKFSPLFKKTEGIICFLDFMERAKTKDRKAFITVRHELYHCSLEESVPNCALSDKIEMAQQLLEGLKTLEENKIVHCAIFPSEIRTTELNGEFKAVITTFERAYTEGFLPEKLNVPFKWRDCGIDFRPPECTVPLAELSRPYAIPMYQLGMCFKTLFGSKSPVDAIIARMIDPDPARRLTASQALERFQKVLGLFQKDQKESSVD